MTLILTREQNDRVARYWKGAYVLSTLAMALAIVWLFLKVYGWTR